MSLIQVRPETLFNGTEFIKHPLISVEHGRVTDIQNTVVTAPQNVIELPGLLVPGFIDVQVNGGGGVLFNNDPSCQTLLRMSRAHSQFGTTGMLATLITDNIEVMQAAANAVAHAIAHKYPGILGLHFEGPHLSVAKKGVHPAAHIRKISQAEWQLFSRDDLGVKMITVAPENISPSDITRLTQLGWIVSLGHSNATAQQVNQALTAGATGFTHLYNAMSPLTSREPGMVGAALDAQNAYCGIIIDTHHVHTQSARIAWQLKGSDKLALVTDAMALVGSEQQSFELFGEKIHLQDDKLTIHTGQLAGSHLSMQQALKNCIEVLGLPLKDVLQMLSKTPANWINQGSRLGQIQTGRAADWVLLDSQLTVTETYFNHQPADEVFNRLT